MAHMFKECPLCQATNSTKSNDRNTKTDLFACLEGFYHLECVYLVCIVWLVEFLN